MKEAARKVASFHFSASFFGIDLTGVIGDGQPRQL
jgi:hypothetical protein